MVQEMPLLPDEGYLQITKKDFLGRKQLNESQLVARLSDFPCK